jgi:hypothetical protein
MQASARSACNGQGPWVRVSRRRPKPIQSNMAGQSQLKAQVEQLQRSLREADRKIADLNCKLAILDPKAALADHPQIVTQCDQRICDQVIALGSQGLSPDEIKANLGIRDEDWEEWSIKFPSFGAATARARVVARAYWSKLVRDSIERGDNRFPVQSWNAVMNQMFAAGSGPRGDASKLLVLDLRENAPTVPKTVRRSRRSPTTTGEFA